MSLKSTDNGQQSTVLVQFLIFINVFKSKGRDKHKAKDAINEVTTYRLIDLLSYRLNIFIIAFSSFLTCAHSEDHGCCSAHCVTAGEYALACCLHCDFVGD